MKSLIAAIVLGAAIGGPASAATSVRVDAPRYTCEGGALSHVAFVQPPAPCCTGMFGCPQLLSNTGLIKPKHSNRT
jgi:hypothetical protein